MLSKEEMAVFAVLNIMAAMQNMVSNLGFLTSSIKLVPEFLSNNEREKADGQIKAALFYPILCSFLVTLVLLFFADQISSIFLKSSEFITQIRIVLVISFAADLFSISQLLLSSIQKFEKMSVAIMLTNISQRVFAIIFYLLFDINGFLVGYSVGYLFGLFFNLFHLREHLLSQAKMRSFTSLIRYSYPFYGESALRFFYIQFDQIAVAIFFTPAQLSSYFIAKRFFQYFGLFINSLIEPMVPKISELKKRGIDYIQSIMKKSFRYFSIIILPSGLLTASLSYFILETVAGPKYVNDYMLLGILSLSAMFYGLFAFFAAYIFILGEPIERFKYGAVMSLSTLILTIFLIFLIGLKGAALASLLSFFVSTLFIIMRLLKHMKFTLNIAHFAKILVLSLFLSTLLVVLQVLYYNKFLVPLYILLSAVIFFVFLIRWIENEDIHMLENIFPKKIITWLFKLIKLKPKIS
jgi:O-antigen/teichoic acid export membrane protein